MQILTVLNRRHLAMVMATLVAVAILIPVRALKTRTQTRLSCTNTSLEKAQPKWLLPSSKMRGWSWSALSFVCYRNRWKKLMPRTRKQCRVAPKKAWHGPRSVLLALGGALWLKSSKAWHLHCWWNALDLPCLQQGLGLQQKDTNPKSWRRTAHVHLEIFSKGCGVKYFRRTKPGFCCVHFVLECFGHSGFNQICLIVCNSQK